MTILYFSKNLNPGFVIMNSLFNPKIKKSDEVIIELKADGKTCATGRGLFVAVKEGHPAYHRWH